MQQQTCTRCAVIKPISEFYRRSGEMSHLHYRTCKECIRYRERTNRLKHKLAVEAAGGTYRKHSSSMAASRRAANRARRYTEDVELVDLGAVFQRQQWRCYLCDRRISKDVSPYDPLFAEMDHRVPLSRGGSHRERNLAGACRECNCSKRAMTDVEYLAWVRETGRSPRRTWDGVLSLIESLGNTSGKWPWDI